MVELKSFPFDSISEDREYSASVFRNYFYKFLSTGIYFGSYKNYGDYSMKVVADEGLNIKVNKGAGLIKGLDFELETDTVLAITETNGTARKDIVVVRADDTLTERKTTLYVKEGTSSDFPELERTNDVYEICLAKITVGNGATSISTANIQDTRRNTTLAGIVSSLIDIDIEDVLDDIEAREEEFFDQEAENAEQASRDFILRLAEMLSELEVDMVPSELVTINNLNYETTTLNNALNEIIYRINAYVARRKAVTLNVANWTLNSETSYYEYTITDTTITANSFAQGHLDIDNQEKLTNGIIETFDGGLKVITQELPEENIDISIMVWRTTAELPLVLPSASDNILEITSEEEIEE